MLGIRYLYLYNLYKSYEESVHANKIIYMIFDTFPSATQKCDHDISPCCVIGSPAFIDYDHVLIRGVCAVNGGHVISHVCNKDCL